MKKLLLTTCFALFTLFAVQAQYINENYSFTYKIKLFGIKTPGEAKNARTDLAKLFDSRHQNYNPADSTITIRSAVDVNQTKASEKLSGYGYTLTYFYKKQDIVIREEETQK